MCMEKTLDIKPIKNLSSFDLIYEFLKSQIETCYVFGLIAIVKVTLETTGVVFVSTELLTCSHIRPGRQIEHSLLQWLSVKGPRSWWDYNYVGLHLFMSIQRVKDVKYYDENSLSLHQSLSVIGFTCNQFLKLQIETCYLRNLLNCAF